MTQFKWTCIAAAGVVLFLGAALASAEEVFVKQPNAIIRSGKGAAYDEVLQVKKGDRVEVVAREGRWLRVRAGSREGYLFDTAVSESRPGDTGGFSKMLGSASGASGASSAEASKGLGESLEFARSRHMSAAGLNRMIAMRKMVTGREWEEFTREGHVGPGHH